MFGLKPTQDNIFREDRLTTISLTSRIGYGCRALSIRRGAGPRQTQVFCQLSETQNFTSGTENYHGGGVPGRDALTAPRSF